MEARIIDVIPETIEHQRKKKGIRRDEKVNKVNSIPIAVIQIEIVKNTYISILINTVLL